MRPVLICVDEPDEVPRNAEHIGQLPQRELTLERTNRAYLIVSQFRSAMCRAARGALQAARIGMDKVAGRRDPLKVRRHVVRLVTVFVVHLKARQPRSDERLSNKDVNLGGTLMKASVGKDANWVSLAIRRTRQRAACVLIRPIGDAANAALVAHLVRGPVRYRSPFLHHNRAYHNNDLNVDARVLAVRIEYGVSSLSS